MDVTEGLRQLGLGEYEARAYATLVAHPGVTGYEVAKLSGIPRAKIYEVLAALAAKDLVAASHEDGRARYHPLAPEVMLQRHLNRAQQVANALAPQLRRLARADDTAPLVTVRSHDHILARAREVIASARRRAFISGWPEELRALGASLLEAEARSVAVYALVYGDLSLPLVHLFHHAPPDTTSRAGGAPWLIVVADHRETLIAEPAPGDEAVALWTQNPVLATVAAEYVKHDIYLVEEWALLEQRGVSLDRELAHLQAMWFDAPDKEPSP